jgi:hypothetical protein
MNGKSNYSQKSPMGIYRIFEQKELRNLNQYHQTRDCSIEFSNYQQQEITGILKY